MRLSQLILTTPRAVNTGPRRGFPGGLVELGFRVSPQFESVASRADLRTCWAGNASSCLESLEQTPCGATKASVSVQAEGSIT
jgi:hypothetical protein